MKAILFYSIFQLTALLLFAQEPKLMLPIGLTGESVFSRYSPDGQLILTTSDDGSAKIWDAASRLPLADYKSIYQADFSPDGSEVVIGYSDSSVKIWDIRSGKLVTTLEGNGKVRWQTKFSHDGLRLFAVGNDKKGRIWNTVSGKLLLTFDEELDDNATGEFSPDNRKILTVSLGVYKVWDAVSGKSLLSLKGIPGDNRWGRYSTDNQNILVASDSVCELFNVISGKLYRGFRTHLSRVWDAAFSPDGKKMVTTFVDQTVEVWDTHSGSKLFELVGHKQMVWGTKFSPDGTRIATAGSFDGTAKIWDAATGLLIADLNCNTWIVNSVSFSADGTRLLTGSQNNTVKIWETASGKYLGELTNRTVLTNFIGYSQDGRNIFAVSDSSCIIWNAASGSITPGMKDLADSVFLAHFVADQGNIIQANGHINIKDPSGKQVANLIGLDSAIGKAYFSPDTKIVATFSYADSTVKLWNIASGRLLRNFPGYKTYDRVFAFSPDSKTFLSCPIVTEDRWLPHYEQNDTAFYLWDTRSGDLIKTFNGQTGVTVHAVFSPDGKQILTNSSDSSTSIWDVAAGRRIAQLLGHKEVDDYIGFTSDGAKIISSSWSDTPKVWDAVTGKLISILHGHALTSATFSPDNRTVVTASYDQSEKLWDVTSGKLIHDLIGHVGAVQSAAYSPDGKTIVSAGADNTCKLWDANTGALQYSFFALGAKDYLVVDRYNRYDGSEAARKSLYFTCGIEVIALDQLKDLLWVPNLAARINAKDSINAPRLSELNVCGLTPLVELEKNNDSGYRFKITPRSGGLSETVLYINGNETKRYKPADLKKTERSYQLTISKSELQDKLIPGQDNPVLVKSFVLANDISSRGAIVTVRKDSSNSARPNLYAVMVGISSYKDTQMDLRYAAKDANDLSKVLGDAARNWFDKDGAEHVFMYNLTTEKDRYLLPEKTAIRKVLSEIGKKAVANDILVIFFAGHGIMSGIGKREFYFLTADASRNAITGSTLGDVGISAAELIDWIQPAHLKAQKRILILDACNSGQAINDIIKIGSQNQGYAASRNDEGGSQIKSIDKLNERAGLFILAASASDQSAYELSRYSQGLLTYGLLKVIKDDPSVLEDDQYLNVWQWFDHASNMVSKLIKENGARQQPQMQANTNFNIGIVNKTLRENIRLTNEKPLFETSNVQNSDEDIAEDNLLLSKLIDQRLSAVSAKPNSPMGYVSVPNVFGAYSINGRYKVIGDSVTVKINLRKDNQIVKKFVVGGIRTRLSDLAEGIAGQAVESAISFVEVLPLRFFSDR